MLRKLSFFLPLLFLLFAAAAPPRSHAQQTIVVNGTLPYPTIQSGIDAANDGDTVIVVPRIGGAYTENISFKGKAITVTGVAPGQNPTGAVLPIIQGTHAEPAVVFQNGETNSSVLSYFNIINGGAGNETLPAGPYKLFPGSIYIDGASPTLLGNRLAASLCYAIYVENGAPLIQGNEIEGTGLGNDCYPPPSGSVVTGGAAILISGDTPPGPTLVYGNQIHDNNQAGQDGMAVPGGGGAGISVDAPAIIQNNNIYDNSSNQSVGGGINIQGGPGVFVMQNLIYQNFAACGGGGIALPGASEVSGIIALIANNTIVDNLSGPPDSTNCALSTQLYSPINSLENAGPNIVIVNNILSDNFTYTYPSVNCSVADPPDLALQPIFDHNILYNVDGSFFGQYCVDVSSQYGNMNADPQFNNVAASDYTLTHGSPAIDAGNTSALQLFHQLSGANLTTDYLGNPRVIDYRGNGYPIIDIGAYEYPDQDVKTPPLPTTMVLSFAADLGKPYTVTAVVQSLQSPLNIPTGLVSFFLDGAPLGPPQQIDPSSGIATFSGFQLVPGTHVLSATYPGSGTFTPAVAIINVIVATIIPTDLLLTYSFPGGGANPTIGQPITFAVHVSADDGTIPRPISLTDLSTSTLLATLTPDASGNASFTISTLTQRGHEIQAAYAGTPFYAPSSDPVDVQVEGAPTTLMLNCSGAGTGLPVGATVPLIATVTSPAGTPPGSVDFKQDGHDLGMSPLSNGVADSSAITVPGYNTFTASYAGTKGFGSSYGICLVSVPSLILTASPVAPSAYSPILFTATFAATPAPAGTYQLTIDTNPEVTVPMSPSADGSSATYTSPGIPQGNYDIKATFTPNDHSSPQFAYLYLQVSAATGDFTLTGPSTLNAPTEGTATGTLVLTSIDNFSGTVALTCSLPLPTTYTCTLVPTSIPLGVNEVATATLTLAPNNLRASNRRSPAAAGIVLATLFPLTLFAFVRRKRRFAALLSFLLVTMVTTTLTACGPDVFYTTTKPGAYPVTITATGTTKGGTAPSTHTLNITLNLTP